MSTGTFTAAGRLMCKKRSARYLLQVEARLGSVQVLAFDVGGH